MNIENHKYHHGNLRDEILIAAYNFVLENGYAAMSLRSIAENCNVSATAIYRHYKTKEHLLADVVVKGFIEFNIFVEGDSEANIFDKCDNYLEFAFDNKNIYDLLFSQSVVEFLQFPDILEVAKFELGWRTDGCGEVDNKAALICAKKLCPCRKLYREKFRPKQL